MKTNKTIPILLNNQKILLIGGGLIALQKAKVLMKNNIDFKLISSSFNKNILKTTKKIEKKLFDTSDINNYNIIIDATGNKKVAKILLEYKKNNNILLNVVDVPEHCDFYFMALTKNKRLQIAVTSNGASPTVSKYFRDECEKLIPEHVNNYLKNKLKQRNDGLINIEKTKKELNQKKTHAYLIGCGLGDPELLTIKAFNTIKKVDVVLYDHLISDEILSIVPKNTKKIYVGKQKNFHTKSQDEINKILLKYVNKNLTVARLKSGDPFVFGRGAEELEYLNDNNINTQVISGISSSISGCTYANIPITARGYSNSFTVVSAHLKDNRINLDWVNLLHRKNHTVVVLMGLSRAKEIYNEIIKLSISTNKECAIISNATRVNQKVVVTRIKNLEIKAKKISKPAILVFGEVVKYHKKFKENYKT